jgi:hypothetical protein
MRYGESVLFLLYVLSEEDGGAIGGLAPRPPLPGTRVERSKAVIRDKRSMPMMHTTRISKIKK